MNNRYLMTLAVPMFCLALALPAFAADGSAAPTTCKDGTTSTSTGKGTCSGHGGIKKAAATAAAAPAAPPAAAPAPAAPAPKTAAAPKASAPAGSSDAAGATAKCKDGTYSHAKSHSGACSKHGGVDQFLTT